METTLSRKNRRKEEKILIIALESEDSKAIANAVKNVISNCILSKGIKVDD